MNPTTPSWSELIGELVEVCLPASTCKMILANGGRVYCCQIPGWKGLFRKDVETTKVFGRLVCDRVKALCANGGFFTSDEILVGGGVLPSDCSPEKKLGYGWTFGELEICADLLQADLGADLLIFFAYDLEASRAARDALVDVLEDVPVPEAPHLAGGGRDQGGW